MGYATERQQSNQPQRNANRVTKPQPEKTTPKHAALLNIQRMIGNQGIQRLLNNGEGSSSSLVVQAKLTVNAPGDEYEQEADSVAQQVVNAPDPALQRQEEEAPIMTKRDGIQREDMPPEEEEEAPIMAKRDGIQREETPPEEEEEVPVQMKSAEGNVPTVTPDLEATIEGERSGGQGLSSDARAFYEPRFGQQFDGVRIHADANADALSRSLEARAFTTGGDIFFRSGEFDTSSSNGRELLAHELTHVVQQGGSTPIQNKAQDQQ